MFQYHKLNSLYISLFDKLLSYSSLFEMMSFIEFWFYQMRKRSSYAIFSCIKFLIFLIRNFLFLAGLKIVIPSQLLCRWFLLIETLDSISTVFWKIFYAHFRLFYVCSLHGIRLFKLIFRQEF